MSTLKELLATPPTKQTLQGYLDTLDEETHTLLLQRMADPAIPTVWLAQVITASGFKVAETTVGAYRRRLVL